MRQIIYYIAISIDGFIAGPNEDISGFVAQGDGVDKYLKDLQEFDTVLMGRKTYEFGYKFGLQPGKAPYPHMRNYIFSKSLKFTEADKNVQVKVMDVDFVKKLKAENGSPIYLCGGGQLASWLLDEDLIDIIKIKLNPFIQGEGVKLFSETKKVVQLELLEREVFENGLQMISYKVNYD